MPLLQTKGLTRSFGGLKAVDNVDMEVHEREILGLIGPNGAGKSTCFNLLSGVMPPTAGQVLFDGRVITGMRPHQIARLGLIRTFQGITVFPQFTVLENALVGADRHFTWNLWHAVASSRRYHGLDRDARERALEALRWCGLADVHGVKARNLPHGTQRVLELAIALAAGPRLLLLDEPFSGLSAGESAPLITLIREIRERGMTVVLVEHHVKLVMDLCDRIVVFGFGQKVAEGTPAEVRENPDVIKLYLGERRQRRAGTAG